MELLEVGEDVEAVDALLAARGWGDGLPVVPPTPARVDAMLAALGDVDPEEVVATLPPRFGEATRRIIAVNAVMAGCAPAHLPVVVTAVRALARPEVNLRGVNATTHCVAPLVIVHGEIATRAGYNGGIGAFGPGNRANAYDGPGRYASCCSTSPVRCRGRATHRPRGGRPSTPTASRRTWPRRRGRATPRASGCTPRRR